MVTVCLKLTVQGKGKEKILLAVVTQLTNLTLMSTHGPGNSIPTILLVLHMQCILLGLREAKAFRVGLGLL